MKIYDRRRFTWELNYYDLYEMSKVFQHLINLNRWFFIQRWLQKSIKIANNNPAWSSKFVHAIIFSSLHKAICMISIISHLGDSENKIIYFMSWVSRLVVFLLYLCLKIVVGFMNFFTLYYIPIYFESKDLLENLRITRKNQTQQVLKIMRESLKERPPSVAAAEPNNWNTYFIVNICI